MQRKRVHEQCLNIFQEPARVIIAGNSNSGKTFICRELIYKYTSYFNLILVCGVSKFEIDESRLTCNIKISEEILNPFDYANSELINKGILFILDDCFTEAVNTPCVSNVFTKGRHANISTIFITQNLFYSGKHSRNISLNSTHFILTQNRDLGQIERLGTQVFGKTNGAHLSELYKKQMKKKKYSYLLIDLSAQCEEEIRIRTNIINEPPFETVLQW